MLEPHGKNLINRIRGILVDGNLSDEEKKKQFLEVRGRCDTFGLVTAAADQEFASRKRSKKDANTLEKSIKATEAEQAKHQPWKVATVTKKWNFNKELQLEDMTEDVFEDVADDENGEGESDEGSEEGEEGEED
eukprot:g10849.t1